MLGPDVFNHNIETVRRLHARMRGAKASYDKALWLLQRAKEIADYPVLTKSGIIVGLGETNDEVVETMRDLRAHGVDVVTIGQYLQPSSKHAQIDRWVHPDEFRWFREQGEALGFGSVFSGPPGALVLPRRRAAARRGFFRLALLAVSAKVGKRARAAVVASRKHGQSRLAPALVRSLFRAPSLALDFDRLGLVLRLVVVGDDHHPSGGDSAHSAWLIVTVSVAVPPGGITSNIPVEIAGVNALNFAVVSIVSEVLSVRPKAAAW